MTRVAFLTAACLVCLGQVEWCSTTIAGGEGKSVRFASERNPFPFLGATRVVLHGFDPADNDVTAAMLQMDKNEVTYSPFGEPRITAALYKALPVKLTRLHIEDRFGKDRRIFSVEVPKEFAADLGKNSLRLVTPTGTKSSPIWIRLLVVNPDDKVMQVLELRPASN